jgi:hypothetical protein
MVIQMKEVEGQMRRQNQVVLRLWKEMIKKVRMKRSKTEKRGGRDGRSCRLSKEKIFNLSSYFHQHWLISGL